MRIGLALSGGGARGIAHLGMLRALEEHQVKFACISGTSVGAILGAMYAQGMRPAEIMDAIIQTRIFRNLRPAWTLRGLLSMESIHSLLMQFVPHNTFEGLKLPLTIAATDLEKGKPYYFRSGPLIPALMASSCVPGMFSPVVLNGTSYVDGGVTDNFPVRAIRKDCEYIVGLHCNPVIQANPARNFKNVLERTLLLAINCNAERSKVDCDLIVEPLELGAFSTFEVTRARELEEIGYAYTKAFLTHERVSVLRS
ncbi:patatin-like phospholipase family protein [Chryseolinea sp. T2]|uniref:patatin-like phospholipase family protein n=1 Tax=Chryseolinea sp. T2 TaxID=3129255 RepID=UPI003077BCA0